MKERKQKKRGTKENMKKQIDQKSFFISKKKLLKSIKMLVDVGWVGLYYPETNI